MNIYLEPIKTLPRPDYPFFAYSKQSEQLILVTGVGIDVNHYEGLLVKSNDSALNYTPFKYHEKNWKASNYLPYVGDIKIECGKD